MANFDDRPPFPSPIPIEALEEMEVDPVCAGCRVPLDEEAYWDGVGSYYCEPCMGALIDRAAKDARAYAEAHCKITSPLPRYDPDLEFRCSPEEYALGDRMSYTPNSHAAHCRHNCTNYGELIRPLDRDRAADQVLYWAIRSRIDDLLEEEAERADDETEDDE